MRALLREPPGAAALARVSASPYHNALLRTTCVATRVEAGHANNALPQSARATVNCRLLPDQSPLDVLETLRGVVADPALEVGFLSEGVEEALRRNPQVNPSSPLRPDVMDGVTRAASELWPGVAVVPTMETGGTDGQLLRRGGIPTYGISGVFIDVGDVRAHGRDERVAIDSFYDGLEFHYRLAKALAGQ